MLQRTALRFIMDHSEVEVWRDTLDGTKRRQLNHPNAIVNAWRKATQTPDKESVEKAAAKEDVLVSLDRKIGRSREAGKARGASGRMDGPRKSCKG
jgi:hypothetical protein